MQLGTFLYDATRTLIDQRAFSMQDAQFEVTLLLAHVLKRTKSWIMAWPEHGLTPAQIQKTRYLLNRRLIGEPIAYILEEQPFWSLTLRVNPCTLIPRPSTEYLVDIVLTTLKSQTCSPLHGLDLGTGSGAIALALAKERPHWKMTGVDCQSEAIELAKINATICHLDHVTFHQSNWFQTLSTPFHFIVSNPPYIANNDPHLLKGDVRFEPNTALLAGPKGLDALRYITKYAPQWLHINGWLFLEHGYNQSRDVCRFLHQSGFQDIQTHCDMEKVDRITCGRYV